MDCLSDHGVTSRTELVHGFQAAGF
jgi:hypothetical protein